MLRHKEDTELENIYIGSTTNFKVRKYDHRTSCCCPNNKHYNHKKYQYIRANGGWDNWKMIWLEDYPCKTLRELQLREDEVMLNYENRINKIRASRTQKEYYENNKEEILERVKQYHKINKDIINEKAKQYRKKNKEQITEQRKQYRKINRDIINEKQKEKIKCNICGCEISKTHLARHQKTIKCQSYLIYTISL